MFLATSALSEDKRASEQESKRPFPSPPPLLLYKTQHENNKHSQDGGGREGRRLGKKFNLLLHKSLVCMYAEIYSDELTINPQTL